MCEALDGRRIVHHHTRRHDDVLTVLRLAREFDLRVVLNHVIEASLVACEIAEAGAGRGAVQLARRGCTRIDLLVYIIYMFLTCVSLSTTAPG